MRIELNYDPVKPETVVCIDGQLTDRRDIYGFLYPVRHCLLQTWLYPSGSWSGLAWQLKELSRGEAIELIFFGRSEDFEDVRAALRNMDNLVLRHYRTNPMEKYSALFAQMDSQIAHILDEHADPGGKKTIGDIFPNTAGAIRTLRKEPDQEWMRVISTEEDFMLADQEELSCCIVREAYLDSYEKIEKLNSLTRSMRRSQDMICCCFEDPEKNADFAHYAAQYENLKIRFSPEGDCVPLLRRKYGSAHALRCGLNRYRRIAGLLNQCYKRRDAVEARRTSLAREKNKTVDQTRELERNKIILNWFDRKAPYLANLNELAARGVLEEIQRKE